MRRIAVIIALMTAGESVFLLPFVLARIFRPTLLDVFEITNLELGVAFSTYGVVAIAAYFAGGPLADRYSARSLMSTSLVATGLGGVVLATIPSTGVMNVLWGVWGATTILLFWSAMLRATREWGGDQAQGRAYGLLDGGRGLIGALIASVTVFLFATMLPVDDPALASLEQRTTAFTGVIWCFTGFTLVVAALVFIVLPRGSPKVSQEGGTRLSLDGVKASIRMPTIWLQAIIVVCAYVGFKATDDFSLLASDALGYDDVQAGSVGTLSFWVRAVTAISAGYLADRIEPSRVIFWGFLLLFGGSSLIASGLLFPGVAWMLIATIVTTSIGVYSLRGVYFALLSEGGVPMAHTGSAIGVISLVGFTPDVFMGPLMGVLLDSSPGVLGHQHVFTAVAAFSFVGWLATGLFRKIRPALGTSA